MLAFQNGGKKKDTKGVQYVIEKIDGMPNADLVIKYKNGKKVGQKVISIDKLKGASSESVALNQKKQKKRKNCLCASTRSTTSSTTSYCSKTSWVRRLPGTRIWSWTWYGCCRRSF